MKQGHLNRLIALALGTSLTMPVVAQENDVERIEVTGSRIKRADLEGPSPVLMISRDDISKTGFDNLQQILERLPVAGVGSFSTQGNNQDSTANGAAAISLRGFGADATLVLINGRRVSISPFAEGIVNSFVDINSIPVSAIERIDILKDGASAIYGSDAVAGVVNIVLRKDFVGAELNASYGAATGPSYDETSFSAVWGTGDDKSNITLILDYFKNTSIDNSELGRFGTANQEPYGGFDNRSSRSFPGSYSAPSLTDPDETDTLVDPACPDDRNRGTFCAFDYGPYAIGVPKAERLGAIIQGRKEVTSDIEFFTEIAIQHNTSEAGGAPTPLDGDAGLTVPATHPNNPWDRDLTVNRYRTVDAGPRRWDIESDSLRMVAGLKGNFMDWDWEMAVQKGRSSSKQTGDRSMGWVRTDFLQQEIDAGRYNPFGAVTNAPDVINDITTSLVRQGESHMTSFDASVSGELFELNGHSIGMAAGYEYREEDVSDTPDDQFQRGLIFGTESVSASASRHQKAFYVEFSIPLADTFELQLAGRYDDYSDFGSSTNPKIAMRWVPIEDLSLRASWSQGFRAPSLAQVGLGPSQESQFFKDTYRCPVDDDSNPGCATTDYTIVFAGNPDLEAEESENWNIGAIWAFAEDADIGFDLWSITQDNKIDEVPFGEVYDANCNDQNSTVCVRLPAAGGETLGELSELNNTFFNVSSQEAKGIDISAHYKLDMADMGNLKFTLEWSHLLEFEKDGREFTGEYEYPENRWVGTLDWEYGDITTTASVRFIGEFEDEPDQGLDGTLDFDQVTTRTVDSQALLDLQVNYAFNEKWQFSVGMNNALDEDPPFAKGDGDDDLYGYASKIHSPRGRFIYTKASYRF